MQPSEFAHPRFIKGRRDLLSSIKRKTERKQPAAKRQKMESDVEDEESGSESDSSDTEIPSLSDIKADLQFKNGLVRLLTGGIILADPNSIEIAELRKTQTRMQNSLSKLESAVHYS